MIDGHNCSQICVELEGSFNCSCYSGYKLQEDEVTCGGMKLHRKGVQSIEECCFGYLLNVK